MDWLDKPVTLSIEERQLVPLSECSDIICPQLLGAMRTCGYTSLFPVQLALLKNFQMFRDYGVVAPTGSGKTLAYIIPVLNCLLSRNVIRLRALIIVPTRVLVLQAHKFITDIIKEIPSCPLKVGCATGKTAFSKEQSRLYDASENRSRVDILICTPGRLVEHLRYTPGFTLKDLQFLVIDEADRLLEQAYQDWLQLVHESTRVEDREAMPFGKPIEDIRWKQHCQLRKIILSASLTTKPAQLMHLHLNNPLLLEIINQSGGMEPNLPPTLSHKYVVVPAAKKPLALLYLLQEIQRCICFSGSTHAVLKLARFLKAAGIACSYITSETDHNVSQSILSDFSNQVTNILISTDGLARGTDLPNVQAVINYDCPTSSSLYVHRAGRSARANNFGTCFTILASSEAHYFKKTIFKGNVRKIRPERSKLQELSVISEKALLNLNN